MALKQIEFHRCIATQKVVGCESYRISFFETTIMGKTADLAVVQKTIIDNFHKEDKSQRVITERCDSLQSAVSKHIKFKVDWKE